MLWRSNAFTRANGNDAASLACFNKLILENIPGNNQFLNFTGTLAYGTQF